MKILLLLLMFPIAVLSQDINLELDDLPRMEVNFEPLDIEVDDIEPQVNVHIYVPVEPVNYNQYSLKQYELPINFNDNPWINIFYNNVNLNNANPIIINY